MDGTLDVLVYRVAGRRHALPVSDVVEVTPSVDLTPLPGAPPQVLGAFAFRGEVVPLIDLAATSGATPLPLRLPEHFVVVATGGRTLALRVDEAEEVLRLEAGELAGAQPLGRELPGVRALAATGGGLLLIRDLQQVLSAAERGELEAALAAAAEAES